MTIIAKGRTHSAIIKHQI